ncbi:hypothetical protein ACTFIW_002450 [Dictyostelium discoideum]
MMPKLNSFLNRSTDFLGKERENHQSASSSPSSSSLSVSHHHHHNNNSNNSINNNHSTSLSILNSVDGNSIGCGTKRENTSIIGKNKDFQSSNNISQQQQQQQHSPNTQTQ